MPNNLKEIHDEKLFEEFEKRTYYKSIIYLIAGVLGCGAGIYISTATLWNSLPMLLGALLVGLSIEKIVSQKLLRMLLIRVNQKSS